MQDICKMYLQNTSLKNFGNTSSHKEGRSMSEQLIISVSREYGSGGHEIAQKLAEYYKLPMYDHNLLDEVAASMNVSSKELAEFDEKRRNKFLYRSVMGMNSSPADNVARMQFDYIKKKAEAGESFVIVGRCSEIVLKDNPNLHLRTGRPGGQDQTCHGDL
jgi:hypothetical protein